MINKVILVGRLGADPESKSVGEGQLITTANLATTEKWKDRDGQKQEKTEWHRLTFWGKTGDIAGKYCKKGMMIYVEGKLNTRKVEGENGDVKYYTSINVMNMQMLGGERQDERPQEPEQQQSFDSSKLKNHAPGATPPGPPAFNPNDDMPF